MKLAAKLITVVIVLLVFLLAVDAYLSVQWMRRLHASDIQEDMALLSDNLRPILQDIWEHEGDEGITKKLADLNDKKSTIYTKWIWLPEDRDDWDHSNKLASDQLAALHNGQIVNLPDTSTDTLKQQRMYVPVVIETERVGVLEFVESATWLSVYTQHVVMRVLMITVAMILIGGAVAVLLGLISIGRPLNRLISKARRIGDGDLTGPVVLRGHDELTELAGVMNDMCVHLGEAQRRAADEADARLNAMEQLRHADRLTTVGRLASGIAHELGTPLNVVSGRAGMVARGDLTDDETVKYATIIKNQADRMTQIIRQLLDFARNQSVKRQEVDMAEVTGQAVSLLQPLARRENVDLVLEESNEPFGSRGDEGQLNQVITNLIMNAIQAMPRGGRVNVELQKVHGNPPEGVDVDAGPYVCVSVADIGPGISDEDIKHVFEPFFTTKDVGEGTGLGLSIAYGIVREHGGWIDVSSVPGEGSRFSVFLPSEEVS